VRTKEDPFIQRIWEKFVIEPLDIFQLWVHDNYIDPYNVVKIDTLGPRYIDKDEILLHASFQILVNYVEVELAWLELIFRKDDPETKAILKKIPWYKKYWPFYRVLKSRDLGLNYLKDEKVMVLDEDFGVYKEDENYGKLSPQAESACEVEALYLWWTAGRPNRPDPWEQESFTGDRKFEIEEAYHAEDNGMLKRLVDIRRSLWT